MNTVLPFLAMIFYAYLPGFLNLITLFGLRHFFCDSLDSISKRQIRFSLMYQGIAGSLSILVLLFLTDSLVALKSIFEADFNLNWHIIWKMVLYISLLQWGAHFEAKIIAHKSRQSKDLQKYDDKNLQTQKTSWLDETSISSSWKSYIIFVINIVIFVPFLEEFVFHYLFLTIYANYPLFALLISSALFAKIHGRAYLTYFTVACLLGANFLITQNFWELFIIHASNNFWVELSYRYKLYIFKRSGN